MASYGAVTPESPRHMRVARAFQPVTLSADTIHITQHSVVKCTCVTEDQVIHTMMRGEGIIRRVQTKHGNLERVHLIMDACVSIVVLPRLVPKHWCREAVVKLSDSRCLQYRRSTDNLSVQNTHIYVFFFIKSVF